MDDVCPDFDPEAAFGLLGFDPEADKAFEMNMEEIMPIMDQDYD